MSLRQFNDREYSQSVAVFNLRFGDGGPVPILFMDLTQTIYSINFLNPVRTIS